MDQKSRPPAWAALLLLLRCCAATRRNAKRSQTPGEKREETESPSGLEVSVDQVTLEVFAALRVAQFCERL